MTDMKIISTDTAADILKVLQRVISNENVGSLKFAKPTENDTKRQVMYMPQTPKGALRTMTLHNKTKLMLLSPFRGLGQKTGVHTFVIGVDSYKNLRSKNY